MSRQYVGINRAASIVEDASYAWATSSTSKDIEVSILDGAGWSSREIAAYLEALAAKITKKVSSVDAEAASNEWGS